MNHLSGKKILLTRSVAQNKTTANLVSSLGATPVLFPCLDITYLNNPIQQGLTQLKQSDIKTTDIIFSSSNGVEALAQAVDNLAATLAGFRIVAIGKKTEAALQALGCTVNITPKESSQLGLIETYQSLGLPEQVIFFRAKDGSESLTHFFNQQGIPISLIHSYQSDCAKGDVSEVVHHLEENNIDAVLLASARTADFYVKRIGDIDLANKPVIAVISPQVAEAADKSGLSVQVIAKDTSFKAMLEGLNQHFAHKD